MSGSILDVYDHEIDKILAVQEKLQERARDRPRNYNDFEREIKERYEDIGFIVTVKWKNYAMNGVVQQGSALPEVDFVGRCDPKFVFDHDQQVHEVTHNILGIPGQEGVIKTDDGEAFRRLRSGDGHGPPHA